MTRRTVYILVAIFAVQTVGISVKAVRLFVKPPPVSFSDADRWYDHVLMAAWSAFVAGALVVYELRRPAREQDRLDARPRGWRKRVELRAVLYAFAAVQMAGVPLAIYKAHRAVNAPSVWGRPTFWSAFSADSLLGLGAGVGVIAYDRRRARRDLAIDTGRCANCGYDLRATPARCPECGLPPNGAGDHAPPTTTTLHS